MNRLPSSEFRKTFARLTEATTVTVHGHVIGEWVPVRIARYQTIQEVKATLASVRRDAEEVAAGADAVDWRAVAGFNSRPFTPVPKVTRRGER
jgi:hypothetical protein